VTTHADGRVGSDVWIWIAEELGKASGQIASVVLGV
jgi:hypothetical protein